jgi:hypothetical protein
MMGIYQEFKLNKYFYNNKKKDLNYSIFKIINQSSSIKIN